MIDRNHIGRKWSSAAVDVEKGRLRMYANAIGEQDPIYLDETAALAAGYRSLLAPPTFAITLETEALDNRAQLQELDIDIAQVLHGEQSFIFHTPICAGDKIRFEAEVVDIYDKKGGALEFYVQETKAFNQNDELTTELRRVIVVRNLPA